MTPVQQSESLSETKRRLLEGYLRGRGSRASEKPATIAPRPKGQPAPLSSAQERILQREQLSSDGSLLHNECITIKPTKFLDADLLQRSLSEIVRRHEILRTTYGFVDGQQVQVVHDASEPFPLRSVDLRAASEIERETELSRIYREGVQQPFDLEHGPLLRVVLVHLMDCDQRIVVFAHLSIVDGVSVYQIFPTELVALYDAFAAGKSSPLLEPLIQYGDYAYWQQQWLQTQEAKNELDYWRKEMAPGFPPLQWPANRSTKQVASHRGIVRSFTLRPSVRQGLKQFSLAQGVTLFTTLTASLSALLYCYTRQDRIVLGTPSLGARKRSEARTLVGHLLNPVPLPIDLQGDPSFHELLLRVQHVVGGALAHDEVPLEVLVRELRSNVDSGSDFFNVALSLQPATSQTEWRVTSMDADSGGTIWDLYLAFIETEDGLTGRVQYSTELFSESTMAQTLEGLQAVMESVVRDPEKSISALSSELQSLGLL